MPMSALPKSIDDEKLKEKKVLLFSYSFTFFRIWPRLHSAGAAGRVSRTPVDPLTCLVHLTHHGTLYCEGNALSSISQVSASF